MDNLKITIDLKDNSILNRYLTIDSILLNLHYTKLRKENKLSKTKFIDIEDDLDNITFLDKQNGVLSGSIWYIEKDTPLFIQNQIYSKTIDKNKYIKTTNAKNVDTSRGELKAYRIGFEYFSLPSLYFYVRGDKNYITTLLRELKFIGKKGSIGFGVVKGFKIETIDKDKSFMIDDTTPAKPLPCDRFNIKSHKVAFYRVLPPYYDKTNLKPCYMPTRALIEKKDNSYKFSHFSSLKDIKYISSSKFVYENIDEVTLQTTFKTNKKVSFVKNNNTPCIICGAKEKEGLKGNIKDILPRTSNDYPFFTKGDFICKYCLSSMKDEKVLGNTFIANNKLIYLQGSKMKQKSDKEKQAFRIDFLSNLYKLEPPFLISFKSTSNSQHTVFKNKVSISNAIVPISYGVEEEHFIDVELLIEAIQELRVLLQNECFNKMILLNTDKYDVLLHLKNKCKTKENMGKLSNFYKKYDRSIRKILNKIVF